MRHADVPTAEFKIFDHPDPARHYIETREYPVVVKADGLAAGKGVVVCSTKEEALAAIDRIMVREEFGREAGRRVVIEKRLEGEELSIQALVSGRIMVMLPPTQDHKAAFDGDTGPNTGGMGAYCPAPLAKPGLLDAVERDVMTPTVHAMKRGRRPFRGVLYVGPDDDAAGAARAGVQLPLRRSGNTAADDAPAHRFARRAGGGGGRPPGRVAGGLGVGPAAGGVRGDGRQGYPGKYERGLPIRGWRRRRGWRT